MRPSEFAAVMEARLQKNRHFDNYYCKSGGLLEPIDGWLKTECSFEHLITRLAEHCGEINGLLRVVVNGHGKEKLVVMEEDLEHLVNQCADVANYAMMIADRAQRRNRVFQPPLGHFVVD